MQGFMAIIYQILVSNIVVPCTLLLFCGWYLFKDFGAPHLKYKPQRGEILVEQRIEMKLNRCSAP